MTRVNRRQFIGTALAAGATVTIGGTKSSAKVMGANDRIRIAVAGLNGRGHAHTDAYLGMKNVEIAYLVDPDTRTYKKHAYKIAKKELPAATTLQDVRKALEDKELNAV